MPNIVQKYEFSDLSSDDLYKDCLSIFNEMGIENIQQSSDSGNTHIRTITGVAPSIWGWGGMKLGIKVYQIDSEAFVELDGFIAQLGVSPLTNKMDEFLKRLHDRLLANYNYDFQYENLTRFLPKYKLRLSKIDGIVILLVIVVTFISTFANVFGGFSEAILLGPVLGLGYYLGKKYLFNNTKIEEER